MDEQVDVLTVIDGLLESLGGPREELSNARDAVASLISSGGALLLLLAAAGIDNAVVRDFELAIARAIGEQP